MGVVAGGDEQPRRPEPFGQGDDHVVDGGEVGLPRRMGRKWEVHSEAGPGAGARLIGRPGSRVERPLVERDERDPIVAIEDLLGAVAMVRIPVDDQDSFTPGGEHGRGDGDIVHQAEPHRVGRGGVMTGRADDAECGVCIPCIEALDRRRAGACGEHSRRPRLAHDTGVGVKRSSPCDAEAFDRVERRCLVDPGQLLAGRRSRGGAHQDVGHPGGFDPVQHRAEAGRPLGMTRPGAVLEVGGMGEQEDRHVRTLCRPCRRLVLRGPPLAIRPSRLAPAGILWLCVPQGPT